MFLLQHHFFHSSDFYIFSRDDFIGSLARKIGANAAKYSFPLFSPSLSPLLPPPFLSLTPLPLSRPEKAEEDTGGDVHSAKHLHPGKVQLNLPSCYPSSYPGDFVKLMVGLQKR